MTTNSTPSVTQADRDKADGLSEAIKALACSDPENATRIVMLAVSDLKHLSAQAFARHRIQAEAASAATIAELVEALEALSAHVPACRTAFPDDPVSAGRVCRESLSFKDFERAHDLAAKHKARTLTKHKE